MIIFTIAGTGYLVAFLVIHLLLPKMEKAKLEGLQNENKEWGYIVNYIG